MHLGLLFFHQISWALKSSTFFYSLRFCKENLELCYTPLLISAYNNRPRSIRNNLKKTLENIGWKPVKYLEVWSIYLSSISISEDRAEFGAVSLSPGPDTYLLTWRMTETFITLGPFHFYCAALLLGGTPSTWSTSLPYLFNPYYPQCLIKLHEYCLWTEFEDGTV